MWIMGREGFVSIVEKPGDRESGQLTLRSRVRKDLDALRASVLPALGPVQAHMGTDYPYRARAPRAAVVSAMAQWVNQIDYANFKDAVADAQGAARASVYGRVWKALLPLEQLPTTPASHTPTMAVPSAGSYGGVLIDDTGRVLLREPTGHFGGYVWTFAKGRPDPGETPAEAALREVREETGYAARITALIPGVFAGTTGTTVMFLMAPVGEPAPPHHETAQVRWCHAEEAAACLRLTPSATGRARDLAILDAALALWRAPGRD